MNISNRLFWIVIGVMLLGFVLVVAALVAYFYWLPGKAIPQQTATPRMALRSATPTMTATRSPTTAPSPNLAPTGKIVFTCQVFGQQEHDQICVINADGSGWRRLTTDDYAENYYPSPSPDGSSLVFASNRSGGYEIYEMNLETGETVQLTHAIGEVAGPEISPDESQIVFAAIIDNLSRILLMNRDGSNPHEVYSQPGADSLDPTWSPDGRKILFASGTGTDKLLYTISPDGSGLQLVSTEFRTRGRSDWSPDGTWIASYAGSPWHWGMFMLNSDGSDVRRIQVDGVALAPAFSPDSQWIVFTGYLDHPDDPDGCEIYVMRIDGSHLSRLTYNNYCDWQPRWGP